MELQDRNIVSSALHGGVPYKSYKKTILAKVYVAAWNTFENRPEGLILSGDPRKDDDESIVDIWSPEEDYFFRQKNKRHLQTGTVIAFQRSTEEKPRTIEEYSDEELEAVLNDKFKKFFSLQNLLNDITSVPVLFRIQRIAEDQERSEKVVNAIKARIAEVGTVKAQPAVLETE